MIEVKETQGNKQDMTEEEFKALARKVLPHIITIVEAAKEYLPKGQGALISINTNGYINFSPNYSKWELMKFNDSERAEIKYEYHRVLDDDLENDKESEKEDAGHDAE